MIEINDINCQRLLDEILAASEEYDKIYFRQKIMRVYAKCLMRNKINLSVKIAEKYRNQLTETLRSDLSIAAQYAIFFANLNKTTS